MQPTQQPPAPPEPESDENALDKPEAGADATNTGTSSGTASATSSNDTAAPPPVNKKPGGIKGIFQRFSIYLLFFGLLVVVAGIIIVLSFLESEKNSTSSIKAQDLSQNALSQLANSNATVGSSQQVLSIESNAIFAGQALFRNSLQVAGGIQSSGSLATASISVSGSASFNQLQATKDLTVGGNAGIQGQATIGQGLQVNGTGTFNGSLSAPQITTSNLQLNNTLTLDHHIVAGGASPTHANGPALGPGGTASLSGSDTSGTVTINTGNNPTAGCFISVTFNAPYDATPHVLLTPVGAEAGGLPYYVTRSTTNFSICDASAPPGGANFSFDYLIVG